MQELIQHIVNPLLKHPESLSLEVTEGETSIFIEMSVHDEDVAAVLGKDNERITAIKHIMSIASGPKKPSLKLTNAVDEKNENSANEDGEEA